MPATAPTAPSGASQTSQTSETSPPSPSFDLPSAEDATRRIHALNEKLIESSKNAGLATLDAYEKTLASLVEFEKKVTSASQLDWVSALATTHAKFITDVSTAYTEAARDLLK